MRNVKVLLCSTLFMAALGWTLLTFTEPTSAANQKALEGPHWRFHDGHWSYWHEGDRRWYYTDGSHWFYHNGTAWAPYAFDKGFGREAFVRGEYKVPGKEARIVIPTHAHYR